MSSSAFNHAHTHPPSPSAMAKPASQPAHSTDPAHNAPEVVPTEQFSQLEAVHPDNNSNVPVAAYYKPEYPGYLPGPYQQQAQPYPDHLRQQQDGKDKRIWGMKRKTFIIIAGVLALLVVGGAVGGGVGAAMANKKDSSSGSAAQSAASASSVASSLSSQTTPPPSSTATITTTTTTSSATRTTSSSTPTSTPSAGMGTYLCPSENGTTYTSSFGKQYTFLKLCNYDSPGGATARNGGVVKDIQSVLARSMDSCIDQCAAQRAAGGACSAVSYGANITLALSGGSASGNCYLKDRVAARLVLDGSGQAEMAYLVD